jgi:hypothetical protein
MIRILVTEEAFEAIKATLPVGSVAFEPEITKGLPTGQNGMTNLGA